jgi:hypothetical protein
MIHEHFRNVLKKNGSLLGDKGFSMKDFTKYLKPELKKEEFDHIDPKTSKKFILER